MATQSSILAWKIPWTEEPGVLWSMGLQRIEPGKSQGWRSLVGWRLWDRTESYTTEATF